MKHNPMAAAGDLVPNPTAWKSLAEQARWLASYADRLAEFDPADLAPTADRDRLAELDTLALGIRSAVAACRRSTWQALFDGGMKYAEIARMWGKANSSTVRNALVEPDRAR